MVVFQASNMFWVRRGMERYALEHRQSVPRITSNAQCRRFHGDTSRHAFQQCMSLDGDGPRCESDMDEEEAPRRESELKDQREACAMPSLPGIKYLVVGKHEGSFYPFADVLHAFSKVTLFAAIANGTTTPVHAGKHDSTPFSRWKHKCCAHGPNHGLSFERSGFTAEASRRLCCRRGWRMALATSVQAAAALVQAAAALVWVAM